MPLQCCSKVHPQLGKTMQTVVNGLPTSAVYNYTGMSHGRDDVVVIVSCFGL